MGLFSKKPKVLIVMVKYERMAGLASKDEIIKFCEAYDAKINEAGGIDYMLLGVGHTSNV